MHEKCIKEPGFRIDVLAYANEMGDSSIDGTVVTSNDEESIIAGKEADVTRSDINNEWQTKEMTSDVQTRQAQDRVEDEEQVANQRKIMRPNNKKTLADLSRPTQEITNPPAINPLQAQLPTNEEAYAVTNPDEILAASGNPIAMDDLTSISQMFLDQQFLGMDRVISYDEGLFTANMSWWGSDS
jgi:hypothetical protein